MKRLTIISFAFFVFVAIAHAAHHRVVDIVGTVVLINESSITVRRSDGNLRTATFNNSTMFLKDDSPTLLKYIHVGDQAVVHAIKKHKLLIAGAVEVGTSERRRSHPRSNDHHNKEILHLSSSSNSALLEPDEFDDAPVPHRSLSMDHHLQFW